MEEMSDMLYSIYKSGEAYLDDYVLDMPEMSRIGLGLKIIEDGATIAEEATVSDAKGFICQLEDGKILVRTYICNLEEMDAIIDGLESHLKNLKEYRKKESDLLEDWNIIKATGKTKLKED